MTIRSFAVLFVCANAVCAGSAEAQSSIGIRGYGIYANTAFAASQTFEAVAGTAHHRGIGGGATVTNVWRGVFVDVGFSQSKVDGTRIFIDGTTVYQLGIPLQITVRPLDVAAGWRLTKGRFSPFAGAGLTSLWYEETGGFADVGDDVSERKSGLLVLGGVDVEVMKWIYVGGELRYRAVKGILGHGGVSQNFGEDRLGGLSAAVRFSVGK
jgi:opacity protein-like surface antigen